MKVGRTILFVTLFIFFLVFISVIFTLISKGTMDKVALVKGRRADNRSKNSSGRDQGLCKRLFSQGHRAARRQSGRRGCAFPGDI